MPVHLVGDASSHEFFTRATCKPQADLYESVTTDLHIGLVNNMPDGALKATERQFLSLLDSASNGIVVKLSLYALPEVPRAESSRDHLSRFYSGIENLWNDRLDGLIVTGAEPRTSDLKNEAYWGSLTKVIDWAEHNTHSAIWSCLAAHAAVLHSDGIVRRRLGDKRFGVFECTRSSDHRLMAGIHAPVRVPNSRWNDLAEDELTGCGYRVLTRAKDGGVDAFVKQRRNLSVFFQGHPEYEANTLLLEYRRDVGRYLRQERDTYPSMPEGYFDPGTADLLRTLQEQALSDRRKELLADFPTALAEQGILNTWRLAATQVYGHWLAYLNARSDRRLKAKHYWNTVDAGETDLTHSAARAAAK